MALRIASVFSDSSASRSTLVAEPWVATWVAEVGNAGCRNGRPAGNILLGGEDVAEACQDRWRPRARETRRVLFFPQPWENSHCVCRLCGLEPSRRLETERGQPEHRPTKVMPTHKPSPPHPNRIPPRNGQDPPRGFAVGLAEDWHKVPVLTEHSGGASPVPNPSPKNGLAFGAVFVPEKSQNVDGASGTLGAEGSVPLVGLAWRI